MNVFCNKSSAEEIKKKVFQPKPIKKDGLVLQIHHTTNLNNQSKRIRFLYSVFDNSGSISANADIDGNIFIVDFSTDKFWSLSKFNSCSILAFSPLNNNDLIVGCKDGTLYIINIHLGTCSGILQGHVYPVKNISFANDQCLTASLTQAIIFNLRTLSKIHELTIDSQITLKQIFFMPVTNNVIACFSDDYIHVWKNKTFESFKKLLPTQWNKIFLKSIAITRNGTIMVLAGISSKLIIFSLDTWTLTKILNLSEEITVKSIEFISQIHDGGANKFLIFLSNNGVLHFLNMEQSIIIAKIQQISPIISFAISENGTHLACVLRSGEVNIYKLSNFIEPPSTGGEVTEKQKRMRLYLQQQKQPKEELNLNKLQGILKQYGEYPESYRSLIWTKILLLPGNANSFSAIIQKGYNPFFKDIERKYPLINKSALKNLKRLLSNLGNWCPIFCHIDFLPLFVFPFIKIFENDPLVCFEAVVTIILNWCQHWFEYAPCVPANVLAMIENILAEHDAQLLAFLTSLGVTSQIYAWSLLEVAFSEIFTIKEWCILWDHILSNEPAFLLMVPVAYNMLCRSILAAFKTVEEFETFYHNQNSVDLKKLISKSYFLLNNTSEANHPRKYLKNFEKLPTDSYPVFEDFSQVLLNFDCDNFECGRETEEEISKVESELAKCQEAEDEKQKSFKIKEEETKRLQELEDMYQEKMLQERDRVDKRKLQLSKLKTDLMEMQAESMLVSRQKIEEINLNDRKRELNKMLKDIEYKQAQDDLQIQQTEEDICKHYVELLKQKTILENTLLEFVDNDTIFPEKYKKIDEQRQRLSKELEEIRRNITFNRLTNKVNIPVSVSLINNKVQKIDMALASEMVKKQEQVSRCHSNMQIIKMESDTKELECDVQNLLEQFTNTKLREANSAMGYLAKSTSDRQFLVDKEEQLLKMQRHSDNCIENCPYNYCV